MARPVELFTSLSFLLPSIFTSYHEFGTRYCDAKEVYGHLDYKGASNLAELNLILCRTVMIRRLKANVLNQLPPKRRQQIVVTCKKKDLQEYRSMFKELQKIENQIHRSKHLLHLGNAFIISFIIFFLIQMGFISKDPSAFDKLRLEKHKYLTEMYKATGKAKLSAVIEYIDDMIESGTKFLLFAHHREVLDQLELTIRKKKVDYIRIDGSTDPAERQNCANHFRESPNCKIALLSITAAGTGFTLVPASNVVFAEVKIAALVSMSPESMFIVY